MTKKLVQAIVTNAEKKKIEQIAERDCRSVSSYVRKAVMSQVRKDEKASGE